MSSDGEQNIDALISIVEGMHFFPLLERGVTLRNSGDIRIALICLNAAAALAPNEWQPPYELGLLWQGQKKLELAVEYYHVSLRLEPANFFVAENLCSCLSLLGRHSEARSILRKMDPVTKEDMERLRVAAQYVCFTQERSLDGVRHSYAELLHRHGGLIDRNFIENEVLNKLDQKIPFSLIRLGDGEGAWLRKSVEEEMQYGDLYDRVRNSFFETWFSMETYTAESLFRKEVGRIGQELVNADIIGIPPIEWIEHEHQIASVRGSVTTSNVILLSRNKLSPQTQLCSQLIHYELSESGSIERILQKVRDIGIISCHAEIAEFVGALCPNAEIKFFKIPGEPSRRQLLGEGAVSGQHFPNRYFELCADISTQDFTGWLFLVAGGILGKRYVQLLKEAGAVALDIGSVADKWLGKKTRPHF